MAAQSLGLRLNVLCDTENGMRSAQETIVSKD